MLQITKEIEHTYEVNKSKFICYLFPRKEFDSTMLKIKEAHPKARHYVYAYRFINEFDQIVENQSDDGEPKGSSGPPALAVLRGNELCETAAIIVRYFGGVKLGIGGLVRAYGKSVNLAIDEARQKGILTEYLKLTPEKYEVLLKDLGSFDHFLGDFENLKIEREFYSMSCYFIIRATEEDHGKIASYLKTNNI